MIFDFTARNGVLGTASPNCVICYQDRPFYSLHPALSFSTFTETHTYAWHFHLYFIDTVFINLTNFKVLRLKCAIFLPSLHNCYEVIKTCHFWNQYLLHSWYFESLNNIVGVQGLTLTNSFFVRRTKNQNPHLHSVLEFPSHRSFALVFTLYWYLIKMWWSVHLKIITVIVKAQNLSSIYDTLFPCILPNFF